MTEESAARIAFVGAGRHSTESLYPNIAHIPEFDLIAVCDLDEGRAARAARRFGAPEHFTDLDKMLATTAPQGVCICGPPAMHYSVGLYCLERGIPVFVEKPPAPDFESCKELVATAGKHKIFGMVGFMKRFAPANLVATEFIRSSTFGKVSTVSLIHGSGPFDDFYSMMIFNGIHMVDLARFLGGNVEVTSACSNSHDDVCKAAVVNWRYQSGAIGSLNMNSGHHWEDCFEQAYVTGTGAGLLIDASSGVEVMSTDRRFAKGEELKLYGWSGRYYVSGNMAGWWAGSHYTRGYWGELSHFARACLGKVQPEPTLHDGLEAMRLIKTIIISIREGGRPVRPDDIT